MDDIRTQPGETIHIPVRMVENYNLVAGWQGTFSWDHSLLSFQGVESEQITITDNNMSKGDISRGFLKMIYNKTESQNLTVGDVLFTLQFKVIGTNKQKTQLEFSSDQLPVKAYDDKINPYEFNAQTCAYRDY